MHGWVWPRHKAVCSISTLGSAVCAKKPAAETAHAASEGAQLALEAMDAIQDSIVCNTVTAVGLS